MPKELSGRMGEPPDWPQLLKTLNCTFTKAAKYSCAGCALNKVIWLTLALPTGEASSISHKGTDCMD